ncbi:hypothetical protein V4D09_02630 [Vibrio mimicus]|uniref:hypothetical protein n=1 Tax=Vibrio mimicus TaxID=674 RepID=UPI002F952FF1
MDDLSIAGINAIKKFLNKNKILSVCASNNEDFWSANCIFRFNEKRMSLIISTKKDTRHAKIMIVSNNVVGTMHSNSPFLFLKKGGQYKGRISLLNNDKENNAKKLYLEKYPLFKSKTHDIWEIELDEFKFTDMKFGKVTQVTWYRNKDI